MTSEGGHHDSSYICCHWIEVLGGLMGKGAAGLLPLRLQLEESLGGIRDRGKTKKGNKRHCCEAKKTSAWRNDHALGSKNKAQCHQVV